MPLSANVVRVLDERGMNVRDVAQRGGISKEAVAMATTFLAKHGYVAVGGEGDPPDGHRRRDAGARRATAWRDRCSLGRADRHPARRGARRPARRKDLLALGLRPHPGGWRGSKPYLAQTEAMLEDPTGMLPHYPMVLHRGGWPDGSSS